MARALVLAVLALACLAVGPAACSALHEADGAALLSGSGRQRGLKQTTSSRDVHPWNTLLGLAWRFYEAQQSGRLPDWNRAKRTQPGGWRDDAHLSDGSGSNVDATGGYYDAGDHIKFALPMCSAFAALGMGAVAFEDGYRAAGEWDNMARNYWWAADYLMRTMNPDGNVSITQVGDKPTDHAYWGRPEQQTGARPLKNQRTADTLGSCGAVLAAASMIVGKQGSLQNATLSQIYLARARRLLAVADTTTALFTDVAYTSSGATDEVALGYVFLCWADLGTAQPGVLPASCRTALTRYTTANSFASGTTAWDWDNAFFGASAVLQLLRPTILQLQGSTPSAVSTAQTYMARTVRQWLDRTRTCPTYKLGDEMTLCWTRGGMVYVTKWGALRHALNGALGVALHARALSWNGTATAASARAAWCHSRSQLLYAAGNNPSNQSYIIGYTPSGAKAADRPHHRSSSCSPDYSVTCDWNNLNAAGPNPSVLRGALVGGPDNLDAFNNVRSDYVSNEVALDYNGGFTSVLAGVNMITNTLVDAGCSWDAYCRGSCDTAVLIALPLGPPPPPPAPPPPSPPTPPPPPVWPPSVVTLDVHPWADLLGSSFLFYEAQQSGALPAWNRARRGAGGWRDDAHTSDGSDVGVDLSGGFYDAGDHMKYLLPMSQAFATLTIGALAHEEGYRGAGEWDNMARNLKYAADYIMKVQNPDANQVYTQVGDTNTDHAYWGRPEQQAGSRPTKAERTADTSGHAAAVLAGASMVFRRPGSLFNTTYATALLQRARQLLAVADANPRTFTDSAYASSSYVDDVALGYIMVCWADLAALNGASGVMPSTCSSAMNRFSTSKQQQFFAINWDWDNAFFAASGTWQLLRSRLQVANGGPTPLSVTDAADYMSRTLNSWQDTSKVCPTSPFDGNYQVCYSAGGLPYLTKWGTLRHALNAAFGATLQAKALAAQNDFAGARRQWCWARGLLMYAAGSNVKSQSYIVGYTPSGAKAADRPHHRSSSCSPDFSVTCDSSNLNAADANPSVLRGALVGGPDNTDSFSNVRTDYVGNEVALDYNAGFTGALAGVSWATNKLSVARCTWASYCSGGCDRAVA